MTIQELQAVSEAIANDAQRKMQRATLERHGYVIGTPAAPCRVCGYDRVAVDGGYSTCAFCGAPTCAGVRADKPLHCCDHAIYRQPSADQAKRGFISVRLYRCCRCGRERS